MSIEVDETAFIAWALFPAGWRPIAEGASEVEALGRMLERLDAPPIDRCVLPCGEQPGGVAGAGGTDGK